jgi:anaerobic magnesium-protoporphyrin IX monomethyl ester cyclase
MKVFLGNAPWYSKDGYGVRAGSRWPHYEPTGSSYMPFPFYLTYATAVLEKAGFAVKLVDAVAEKLHDTEFISRVNQFQPDLVLLETSTPTINVDLKIAKNIKQDNGNNIKIALSGPHVSVVKDSILKEADWIDYVLVGEYEYTLRDLAIQLNKNESLNTISGLIFRDNGNIVSNTARPPIENLDELPRPAYSQLPMLDYNDDATGLPKPNVQMWASRGCPFQCNFCLWPQVIYGNHRYRARDPIQVVDEMEWLIDTYGFKGIYFDDDTFDIGKPRILKLCAEIKQRRLNIPWSVMARADTLDQEMLIAMADAGMIAIKYGVESGVQELVDNCGKHLDLNKVKDTVAMTKVSGIKVHLTFSFGLSGETKETIQKTIDYALSLDPDSVQFSIITPFPGTKYYDELKEKGFIYATNWSDFDGNRSAVIRTEHLSTEDLIEAFNRAYAIWHEYQNKTKCAIRNQKSEIDMRSPIQILKSLLQNK